MTSRHNSLNLALQEHIEQLIKQDGYYNDTLAYESLQATLSTFCRRQMTKILNTLTNLLQSLLQNLRVKWAISKAMDLHGKNALPKRKIRTTQSKYE